MSLEIVVKTSSRARLKLLQNAIYGSFPQRRVKISGRPVLATQ